MSASIELMLTPDNEADWLAARLTGLTGSDTLAALGLDPNKSRLALWQSKLDPQPVEETPRMRMGRRLEPVIMAEFAHQTGLMVEPANVLLRSIEWPFLLASPDGWVYENGQTCLYEAKSTTVWLKNDWADGEVPIRALAQVAHYLAVTGLQVAYVAVMIDNEVSWRRIERDDDLIADIVSKLAEFWRYVEHREMPPIDYTDVDVLKSMWPESQEGTAVEVDSDVVSDWRQTKAELALLEMRKDALENRIRQSLEDAETGLVDGVPVVSYKTSVTRRLDQKALKAAEPEVAEKYTTVSSQRTLRMLNRKK
jgi:putative phage-type endonuclease